MTKPVNYDFNGWGAGEYPVSLFDAGRWSECMHATVQALNVIDDAEMTQRAVMDTGVLHELAHLSSGLPVCTHHGGLAGIRAELVVVSELVAARLGDGDER